MSIKVSILNVFTDQNGHFGNPVGIIIDLEKQLGDEKRLHITQKLGFSECVFVNNIETPEVSIFNPQEEVSFAGHALLGTAYFIKNTLGKDIQNIHSKSTITAVELNNGIIWISSDVNKLPPWNYEEFSNLNDLLSISDSKIKDYKHTYVWSWLDRNQGKLRARTFAPDWGIIEDAANGSGTMKLSHILNADLEVIHGKGSQIFTRILDKNICSVGGRVNLLKEVKLN